MNVGTKSVIAGAHQFFIHPTFVALAWVKLYGFRATNDPYLGAISIWHPLLWLSFFVHDLGYLGLRDMDGEEGEQHPKWGARLLMQLSFSRPAGWYHFCLFHSRYMAKLHGQVVSRLCIADKLSTVLEPWWLYLPRVIATGEIREYMARRLDWANGEPLTEQEKTWARSGSKRDWFRALGGYLRRWAASHKDGGHDSWTNGGMRQVAFRAAKRVHGTD